MIPIVAIVGRPNVGKSTLFNRLIGRREAIVEETPGVTRDRHYADAEWAGFTYTLIDTGGWVPDNDDIFNRAIREQVTIAIDQASVILFVVDGTTDLLPLDHDIARMLRKSGKKVLLVVNKMDAPEREGNISEFHALGLGEPLPVAALGGRRTGDFLDCLIALFPKPSGEDEIPDARLHIAIVGRPNVGKSSLTNALIGEDRHIVTDIPGTTRDSIDSVVKYHGDEIVLIDTAGLRKKKYVDESIEFYSTMRTIKALDRCSVAIVMFDATEGLHKQDSAILAEAIEKKKGVMIVVNKWDLVEDKETNTARDIELGIHTKLKMFDFVPVLFISAKTHEKISNVLKKATEIAVERARRITTSELNDKLLPILENTPPPSKQGRDLRVKFITQVRNDPPTFAFFINHPDLVEESYKRYLENTVRKTFGFKGVPIGVVMKKK